MFEALEPRRLLAVDHVVQISVDGLASRWLEPLLDEVDRLPSFQRLMREGTFTTNARTDFSITNTLPNHTSMLTGRPSLPPLGQPRAVAHNWTSNSDPAEGVTLHNNHPDVDYIVSVLDLVHDRGGQTGLFTGKSKFSLFDVSYDADHGAPDNDATAGDNGSDKLDLYHLQTDSQQLVDEFAVELQQNPFAYSLLHLIDADSAGHQFGWGSEEWDAAIERIDGYLGKVIQTIEATPALNGQTAILITADHGGNGFGHDNPGQIDNYRIPFFLWGPQVPAGADVYDLFSAVLADPGATRPDYNASPAPIRNGDSANVALALLGDPPIPDSWLVGLHACITPASVGCQKDPIQEPSFDFGDAPLPYRTTKALSGAYHRIEEGFYLGSAIDAESDGQPDQGATGDDLHGDDEDGVVLVGSLRMGETATLEVTASQAGNLQAWIDWNQDGDWADLGEHVFADVALVAGSNQLAVQVPTSHLDGSVVARFRFAHETGLSWTGPADSGEVEDYRFPIERPVVIKPLVATNDAYKISSEARDVVLNVLANDRGDGPLRIRNVSTPDQGGQVSVSSDWTSLRYTPSDGFVGLETFSYNVQDERGQQATARVTVQIEPAVVNEERVKFRMELVGPDGGPTTELRVGDPFYLAVLVQDVRPSGAGVAAAYLDVSFAAASLTANGSIEHGSTYTIQTSGQITPGQIDEAGGRSSSNSLGTEEHLLFQVPLKARGRGSVTFALEPADETGHDVRLTGVSDPIPPARWLFDSVTVVITPFQNESQPEDVDEDGWITPLDALLVINDLNRNGPRSLVDSGERPEHLVDVNGDDYASAVDALLVINRLNRLTELLVGDRAPEATWSTAESSDESAGSKEPVDDIFLAFAALDADRFWERRFATRKSPF
jgi:hypothetical protein